MQVVLVLFPPVFYSASRHNAGEMCSWGSHDWKYSTTKVSPVPVALEQEPFQSVLSTPGVFLST